MLSYETGACSPERMEAGRTTLALSRSFAFSPEVPKGAGLAAFKGKKQGWFVSSGKGWSEAVEIVDLELYGSWRATAGAVSPLVSARGRGTLKRYDQRRPAGSGAQDS